MKFFVNYKIPISIIALMLLLLISGWFYINSIYILPQQKSISLSPKNGKIVAVGQKIYEQNCASCHGPNLEGAVNWRQRDADGYLPAPPHDQTGHTWHHADDHLFSLTKYGIEKMIQKKYPNNMPAYENILSDHEIIAVLSYIKSSWPRAIQRRHDQLNARINAQQRHDK